MDDIEPELRALYERLAAHWKWPMPATWDGDRETILGDPDAALLCLRNLVADLPLVPVDNINEPEFADLRPEVRARYDRRQRIKLTMSS